MANKYTKISEAFLHRILTHIDFFSQNAVSALFLLFSLSLQKINCFQVQWSANDAGGYALFKGTGEWIRSLFGTSEDNIAHVHS